MQKTLADIKLFLKEKTPEKLQESMLENNIKTSSYHDYRIMFVNEFWYAWFEANADEYISKKMTEATKAGNE